MTRDEKFAELRKKCQMCMERLGPQSYDHCNYHCTVGAMIHRLDFEQDSPWKSHEYWKEDEKKKS